MNIFKIFVCVGYDTKICYSLRELEKTVRAV